MDTQADGAQMENQPNQTLEYITKTHPIGVLIRSYIYTYICHRSHFITAK